MIKAMPQHAQDHPRFAVALTPRSIGRNLALKLTIPILLFLSASNSFSQIESFDGHKAINGANLYFKVFGQPHNIKTGKGAPLLIVHGGPGLNHSYLLPHLKKLSKQYTLIFYDQRASGRSSIPSSDSVSLKFFVEDIEAIRKNFGIEKILIFSHSWGAIPAVQYALDYPDNVRGIIFCNPIALSKEYDNMIREAQVLKATGRDSTNRSIIIGSPDFKAGKADAYRRLLLLSFQNSFSDKANLTKLKLELQDKFKDASGILYTGLSKDLAHYNYYGPVQRFKFPVLILHGRADMLPLQASERMLESIPNSRLSIFRSSGHFIFIEEPKRFYSEVTSFSRLVIAQGK
jgi:proline iminopeptidase